MPEMPEVETIKRGLSKYTLGASIKSVRVLTAKSVTPAFSDCMRSNSSAVINAKIANYQRFGKLLVINLDSDYSLLIHLRMTGQLVWRNANRNHGEFGGGHPTDSLIDKLPDNSTRVVLNLESENSEKATLFFNDQRKFGFIDITLTKDLPNYPFIASLGPEPPKDKAEFLKRIRRHKNIAIKPAILDQKTVSGIGNIYADECLWMSKVHPLSLVKSLSDEKLLEIYENAAKVMQISISHGGSTSRNYVNAEGKRGAYLDFANVFRRQGQRCTRCSAIIVKIWVGGRGTHFCPKCQILSNDNANFFTTA